MPTQRTLQLTALVSFIMACAMSFLTVSSTFAHPINPTKGMTVPSLNRPTLQATGLITVSPISLTVTEPNGSSMFTITLSNAPTAPVTINLTPSNNQCIIATPSVTLTNANWNVGVTTRVTATNDQIIDGDQACVIQTAAASSNDPTFKNVNPSDITVTVKDDGQGPILQVTPLTMSFRLQKGITPDPFAQQYVTVKNSGTGTLNWNVSKDASWLQVIRFVNSFADLAVSLQSSAATLPTGLYTGTITIDGGAALNSPFQLLVYLEIYEPKAPTLQITPNQLTFSGTVGASNPPNQTLQIKNGGDGTITWAATENSSWLSLNQTTGSAPSNPIIAVNLADLAAGTYTEIITVTSAEVQNSPQLITVTLKVDPSALVSKLGVSPSNLTFNGQVGAANPAPQSITISNLGQGTLSWSATETIPWLNLSSSSGTAPATPHASIDLTGLAVGIYTGTITINGTGALDSPQSVMVTLAVAEGATQGLQLQPNPLTFQTIEGQNKPLSQSLIITNSLGTAIGWVASESIPWLSLESKVGTTPATITTSIDVTGLAVGIYNGLITVTAPDAPNSPQTVVVTLIIDPFIPQPELHLSQTVSAYQLAKPQLLTYTLTLTNSGQAVASNAALIAMLPPEVVFVSASNGGTLNNQTVTWPNITVAIGEMMSYALQVSPTVKATIVTNTAIISLNGVIQAQSQVTTLITSNQNSIVILPNVEAVLPIPNTPHEVRFPPTVTTESQQITAITLDKPSHETTLAQVANPDASQSAPVLMVDKSGLAFQLTAQGVSTMSFIAAPAQAEIKPYLQGTPDDDILFSFTGSDTLWGNAGNDVIYGGEGNDILQGEAGNDKLYGEGGNDTIYGGSENDVIYGGAGDDTIYGGDGNDILFGEDGNDIIFGRQGNDTLLGSDGVDTFGLTLGEGADIIVTFIDGQDKLGLPAGISFADLVITQDGTNSRVAFGAETLATLQGIAANVLNRNNFTYNVTPPTRRAELSAQQTTLTDWYLYYWNENQQLWQEATTTCNTPTAYTRTDTKITIPICHPGEFTWLRITSNPPTGPIQLVYLPLVVK